MASMTARACPPSASCSSRVSIESRYGTCLTVEPVVCGGRCTRSASATFHCAGWYSSLSPLAADRVDSRDAERGRRCALALPPLPLPGVVSLGDPVRLERGEPPGPGLGERGLSELEWVRGLPSWLPQPPPPPRLLVVGVVGAEAPGVERPLPEASRSMHSMSVVSERFTATPSCSRLRACVVVWLLCVMVTVRVEPRIVLRS